MDLSSRNREERSMVPDRTGSVRGLSRRSFHRIAFTDWGPAVSDLPVLCVHGLTRNGRDFDHLGTALASKGRRVICPDLPGRGQSERLKDSSDYVLPQYCSDMTALIAALGAVEIDWVGTSLGGLIGIVSQRYPATPSAAWLSTISDRICLGLDCFASAPILMRFQRASKPSEKQNCIFGAFWLLSEKWRTSIGVT
jgi:pimeloyl-ACP methyl ester carboxylesterase